MAGYFWTEEEIFERVQSNDKSPDQITAPHYSHKWTVLNHGECCTLNCATGTEPGGYPLHIHKDHDEVIIYLEVGEGLGMQIGDEVRKVKKGDVVFVPKGTPHTGRVACTALSIYSPAFDTANPDRHIVE